MKILWIFSAKIDVSLLILIKLSRKVGSCDYTLHEKDFPTFLEAPFEA